MLGFDPFMNLVIDECVEVAASGQQNNIGMVVIGGNSIIMLEALEKGEGHVQQRNQVLIQVPFPTGLFDYIVKLRSYTLFILNFLFCLKKNVLCPHSPCPHSTLYSKIIFITFLCILIVSLSKYK